MTRVEVIHLLEEFFEQQHGSLNGAEDLDDLDWDSMKALEFIVLIDDTFQGEVAPDDLAECQKFDDLLKLLGEWIED